MLPAGAGFLGWSREARAIPLLRLALLSPNHMIEIFAAKGLAEIGDKDSIPFIIDASKKAPKEAASVIAESLVYFDDNSAQSAVDQYIPKDQAKICRDAETHGPMPLSSSLYDKLPDQFGKVLMNRETVHVTPSTYVSDLSGGLNGWTQHLLEVRKYKIPKDHSFSGLDQTIRRCCIDQLKRHD
jgi:PBS lyase HEAT-like repeat